MLEREASESESEVEEYSSNKLCKAMDEDRKDVSMMIDVAGDYQCSYEDVKEVNERVRKRWGVKK